MARILIIGAGAIGQWLGGRLAARGGQDVTVVCRRDAFTAISQNGIVVRTAQGDLQARTVRAAESVAAARDGWDWIFVTVKAFDVESALREMAEGGLLGSARVMGLQNGVGTEELMARAAGQERTFVCVVTRPIEMGEKAGEVTEAATRGGLSIASFQPGAGLADLEALLRSSDLPLTTFDDYRDMKWSKLLLNICANALCAILDYTPAEIYADKELFAIEHRALKEATAVMNKLGIHAFDLPGYPAHKLWLLITRLPRRAARLILRQKVGTARGSKPPSLRLEMDRARPRVEVDYLNGAVVEFGRRCGVATPANSLLTDTLNRIVSGQVPWERYRRNRQAVLDEMQRQ